MSSDSDSDLVWRSVSGVVDVDERDVQNKIVRRSPSVVCRVDGEEIW